jgi:hypothetical protein
MFRFPRIYFASTIIGCFVLALLALSAFPGLTPKVDAQASSQLVPLVTDQTPMALSNSLGVPTAPVVNQAGDYAFIGNGGSAVFYRSAGSGAPVRVIQMGDEVPGFPGSRADIMLNLRLNNAGLIAFGVDFFQANGIGQRIIFTFDGTTLQRIVAGNDPAPGGGGANFERGTVLTGLNDSGDIAFTAGLVPAGSLAPQQPTLYIVPAGGSPVRVTGLGDTAPGTAGGTIGTFTPMGFNNLGEQLFSAVITSGSGTPGLFVGDITGVRKVMAQGDVNPLVGTLSAPGNVPGFGAGGILNNAGQVAFQASGALWIHTPGTGLSRVVSTSDTAPAPYGGGAFATFNAANLQAFNDAGEIAFQANVTGSAAISPGLFRYRPANPIEVVAHRTQSAPSVPGQTFSGTFNGISINATGVVSFRATLLGGPILNGIFQQTGTNPPVKIALDGEATTLPGGGAYSLVNFGFVTQTLNSGAVYVRSDIAGGTADYAEFLISAGVPTILMNTADALPAGARVLLRTFRVSGAGDQVGFLAQKSGGRFSIAVHNIATTATTILTTDGDAAPGTVGGVIRLTTRNTVFQNTAGTVVFTAQIIGGSGTVSGTSGIFLVAPGSGLTKIVANGDVAPGTGGKTFLGSTISNVTPSAINDAGQVAFLTTLLAAPAAPGPSLRALFVWSPGTGASKVAAVGDLPSAGGPITSFAGINTPWINGVGQVAFIANTGAGAGVPSIYVGTPGGTPTKIVGAGDAGPGGSTFALFGSPGFNDSGEVAFMATLTGGPGGGVFVGSPSVAPVPLVLDGDLSPAGGTFSITTARPEVLINNQHDVAFRGLLTGGTADSGYFMRRGPAGVLAAVALQGQPAPGTTGVFETIQQGVNNLVSENFQLGPDGDLAFQSFVLAGGQRTLGVWHVKTDNTVEEILVRGQVAPEFGGGSPITSTASTSWNSGGRYPVWARVSGGTFTEGIFLFVPTVATNTPAGTSVPVTMTDSTTGTTPVALTFASVTTAGATTLTTSSGGPAIPTAFSLGDPPVFYNIETTATFAGSISVCIDFSNVSFPSGAPLRLLHFEGGVWVDVTTSGPTGNIICGNVTSLSPFTVVQQLDITAPNLTVTLSPNSIWPANKKMVNISASIQVSDGSDPTPQVRLVSITCNETLGSGDIQGATFNTDDRAFQLRATRAGNGPGRIYTVTYRATDATGNTVLKTAQVIVPHDQGH